MRPVLIGVAGGSGSGKTTVSAAILERVRPDQLALIQHDMYYRDRSHLPAAERARINYDHPDSLETDLLVAHLQDLRAGRAVEIPQYDFALHIRKKEMRRVEPRPVILVEGILIFVDAALRHLFDVKIFVDADSDLRFIRRLERDIAERGRTRESVVAQYLETVRPMHLEFVEPSKRYADVIIPEGGHNLIAINMVVARMQEMLDAA
ncbi:MAG: uridine kinase [Chloroflexi bacterium]|nr:uridine kinase [Chloroflexota bacterium]